MLGLQRIFYGPLRPLEVEQLYEKAWIAITETCFAMTMFRGELGGWFLIMFLSLLASRVWSWIGEGRVEILEQQPPPNPRLFHTRLAASLVLSALFNSSMLEFCVKTVLKQARPDMMVMFGFEFAVLTTQSVSTIARYAISLVEIWVVRKQKQARLVERRAEIIAAREESARQDGASGQNTSRGSNSAEVEVDEADLEVPGWEEKGKWILYLELLTGNSPRRPWSCTTNKNPIADFVKLSTYLAFFWILLIFYGLPIHIFRDVYVTFRSFVKRINDFRKYKKATRDMEARYPDATSEEISREDVCIICREEMRPIVRLNAGSPGDQARNLRPLGTSLQERMRPKKLPCGHVLHFSCLRSWLERQQICPTCRRPVVAPVEGNAGPINRHLADAGGIHERDPGHNAVQRARNGQNQARVFQLGPLRIVFGRGRGNLYGDLANQIHQGDGGQQQPEIANAAGPQQIGFGFGIGRRPAPNLTQASSRSTLSDVQSQLQRIENHINQEISSLRATADQLNLVRALQNELERLRTPQNTRPTLPIESAPSPFPQNLVRPHLPPGQVLVPNEQQYLLQAGDDRLPQGLALPEGWTMMPLQRVEQRLPGPQPAPSNQILPNLRPTVTESIGAALNGSANNVTPLSNAQVASPVVHTTSQPQQPTAETFSSMLNDPISQPPITSSTTSSRFEGDIPPERPRSTDTFLRTSADLPTESRGAASEGPSTNTEPGNSSIRLPSWGAETMANAHNTLSDRRAATSDPETHSSRPDHSMPTGGQGRDGYSSSHPPEKEEKRSLAASVEDCIEDVD